MIVLPMVYNHPPSAINRKIQLVNSIVPLLYLFDGISAIIEMLFFGPRSPFWRRAKELRLAFT